MRLVRHGAGPSDADDRPSIYVFMEKLYGGNKQKMGEDLKTDILIGPLCRHAWSLSPPPPRSQPSLLRRASSVALARFEATVAGTDGCSDDC